MGGVTGCGRSICGGVGCYDNGQKNVGLATVVHVWGATIRKVVTVRERGQHANGIVTIGSKIWTSETHLRVVGDD